MSKAVIARHTAEKHIPIVIIHSRSIGYHISESIAHSVSGLTTWPRNGTTLVFSSTKAKRMGRSATKSTVGRGALALRAMTTAVAAATTVPSSSTSMVALWHSPRDEEPVPAAYVARVTPKVADVVRRLELESEHELRDP